MNDVIMYQNNVDKRTIRRKLMQHMLGGECLICGTKEKLEFDHIDSKTKEFDIAVGLGRKWKDLYSELLKCQLLCKSCHIEKTKLTSNRRKPQHGEISMYTGRKCRCEKCKKGWKLYHRKRKHDTINA